MATMSGWSRLMLGAYYLSTLPARLRVARLAERTGQAPLMILFYHRIADRLPNDWSMPYGTFVRQIRWLRKNFELISLSDAHQRLVAGTNERSAVCITFDDGYAENCDHALPLLIRERIPFAYFVCSTNVLEGRPFPHDLAAGRPLRPNNREQLHWLVDNGVEIGAHTRSHENLGPLRNDDLLHDEIVGCRGELMDQLACPIRFFSFPYGAHANLSRRAFEVARDAGYTAVCSAYGGYNFPGDDPFHLQRIHADIDTIRLKNWLTVDPGKLVSTRRFFYRDTQNPQQLVET